MKITEKQLRNIIKESIVKVLSEQSEQQESQLTFEYLYNLTPDQISNLYKQSLNNPQKKQNNKR